MVDKLKQMHWKKILLMGGILMVALVGLCVQKPEGIKTTPLQPAEELKLSDFSEVFKEDILVVGESREINVDITQGQTLMKKIIVKNRDNQTLNGKIKVINVKCGVECPWAKILTDKIHLEPGESKVIEIEIKSHLMNVPGITELPIVFSQDDRWGEIGYLNINVKPNYLIYAGIPAVVFGILMVFWIWRRRRR